MLGSLFAVLIAAIVMIASVVVTSIGPAKAPGIRRGESRRGGSAHGYSRILCAVAFLAPFPSAAHQPIDCADRSEFVRYLADTYDEKPIGFSVTDSGKVIEFLFSESGESWTIITATPDGIACRVAAGKVWEFIQRNETQKNY